jgi:hypothetical protein
MHEESRHNEYSVQLDAAGTNKQSFEQQRCCSLERRSFKRLFAQELVHKNARWLSKA